MSWLSAFPIIPSIGLTLTAGFLILLNDRRLILIALACQYCFVAWFVGTTQPLHVAAAKLVAGLLACSIIALALARRLSSDPSIASRALPSGFAFRVIAFSLVLLTALGVSRANWAIISTLTVAARYGVTILFAVGLLQIGLHEKPLWVGVGLLTILAGFEIAYTSVEPSLAVMALLAAVHLGIAVAVSYLLILEVDGSEQLEVLE